jgi:DNA-binding NtrC family response regulator
MAEILVIDDDVSIRELLRQVLEREDHAVSEAADGHQAMLQTQESRFDLIITDILMPERDGFEVIRQVTRRNPQVKIIALSGGGAYLGLEVLDTAKDFGAVEALAKPFDVDQLLHIVKDCCPRDVAR